MDGMHGSLTAAGFDEIAMTEIEVSQSFKDFDEYWEVQTLAFRTVLAITAANAFRELLRAVTWIGVQRFK